MRMMKSVVVCVGVFALCLMMLSSAIAGVVHIEGGKTREGQVIVRENVVTVNSPDNKLFQFYSSRVTKIATGEEGKSLLSEDILLKQEPADDADSAVSLSRGMEVEQLEESDGWSKIKGVRENETGWVKSDVLVKEVDFSEEQTAAEEAAEEAGEAVVPEAKTEEIPEAATAEMPEATGAPMKTAEEANVPTAEE